MILKRGIVLRVIITLIFVTCSKRGFQALRLNSTGVIKIIFNKHLHCDSSHGGIIRRSGENVALDASYINPIVPVYRYDTDWHIPGH